MGMADNVSVRFDPLQVLYNARIPIGSVDTVAGRKSFIDLKAILGDRFPELPHVLRLLIENHVRATGNALGLEQAIDHWCSGNKNDFEFTFQPNRILMHDTTCTPALADIAAMRDVLATAGVDPTTLSPQIPVDVCIDHSIAVDAYARADALQVNQRIELHRNAERYAFLKWASQSLENFNVYPPGSGIMHTINLEQLASVLMLHESGLVHPDMMLGTDSHTPMVNGIGVLGWGVGGLEAESVLFGQAVSIAFPEVIGVELVGKFQPGTLATDLALEVTHQLRKIDVAGSFVEFFGTGLSSLSADDRAVVANMAPEYGATTGFFPVDQHVVDYLERTARNSSLTQSIKPVFVAQGLWFDSKKTPKFDRCIRIDLSRIRSLVAGPERPQDRHAATDVTHAFEVKIERRLESTPVGEVPDGAVAIAAITSCTNTSSPKLLIAAGLLARKAREKGLVPPPWVKTSLAPGSTSAQAYLNRVGLLSDLSAVGFDIVGFGCTTCIGNSGALPDSIQNAQRQGKSVAAVISGNRNFPGRVNPKLELCFIASPPMVLAYALKGALSGDIHNDPIGHAPDGEPVYMRQLWPTDAEIEQALVTAYSVNDVPAAFAQAQNTKNWQQTSTITSPRYSWNSASMQLRPPKFVLNSQGCRLGNYSANPLLVLGDDMTTDHISPAGAISSTSEAGKWLIAHGAIETDLNVYASYRGNWEVMLRGLFTNTGVKNYLAEKLALAHTEIKTGVRLPIYKAALQLQNDNISTVILAGERYGMGSSRDWAAKGVALLGVRAIIARSFERIHRSNLIGMGILPIVILDDFVPANENITSAHVFCIDAPERAITPGAELTVKMIIPAGDSRDIVCRAAVETSQEVALLRAGGTLPTILANAGSSSLTG